jgi:uncharacterized protein involved in exopolysaccharide biosynthesis
MTEPNKSPSVDTKSAEIDLLELVHVLWAGKRIITSVTALAIILSVVFSLRMPNIYRAEALLAPSNHDGAGGLPAMASQYGGLASLVGISLADSQTDKTKVGIEILRSRRFISEFVARRQILVPLMAAEGWNAETGELQIDPKIYDVESAKWTRKPRPPRRSVPSSQEAYQAFRDIMSIDVDKKSSFVNLTIEHYSPLVAKDWVDWLVEDINSTIMRQDVAEAEQAIDYLNEQIESISLADLHDVFFNLIEEQTKTVMLAKVTNEYLLETLDPAVVPELKSRPMRSLIVIFCAIFGFLLAAALVLLSEAIRQRRIK